MRKSPLLHILFILLVFTGCEKVITLHLKNAEQKIVIEATITNTPKESFVYISRTQPLSVWNKFDGLSFAKVMIADSKGKTDTLFEIEKGIYHNEDILGVPGETYHLTVSIDSQLYTSTSTMPKTLVQLDSMQTKYESVYRNYVPSIYFSDPENEQNYYLFFLYKNNKKYNAFFVQTDEFINGKSVKQILPIFSNEEEDKIQRSDTVKVRMMQITKPVYTYFYSLNAGGSGSFGTPSNPVSNIVGQEVLGYFSAQLVQTKSMFVAD